MASFCSICISNMKTDKKYYMISTEDCKHFFCLSCSIEWFYLHKRCPNCNTYVRRILKIKNKPNYSDLKTVLIIDLQNVKFYSKEMFIYLIKNHIKDRKRDVILYKFTSLIDTLGML